MKQFGEGTVDLSPFTPTVKMCLGDYLDAVVVIFAAACLISAATGAGCDT